MTPDEPPGDTPAPGAEPHPPAAPAPGVRPRSATLGWAARLLMVEAAGLAAVTAYLIRRDLTVAAGDRGVALALTGCAALAAGALVALSRALGRGAARARGPAIVLQLMLLVTAYYMVIGGLLWLGAPVALVAVVAGTLVLTPSSTRALGLG